MSRHSDNARFVPFCDTVLWRYQRAEDLPRHDTLDPALCSGQIHVTLTARTPVCVAGGRNVREQGLWVAHFARDGQERYCIPGSSLRGLLRQNMQILGLGAVRIGEEIPDEPVAGGRKAGGGLPDAYRRAGETRLDYVRAMMGFVRKVPGDDGYQTQCCRSRVSVGTLTALGTPVQLEVWPVRQRTPDMGSAVFIREAGGGRFRLSGTRQYPPRDAAPESSRSVNGGFRPLAAGTAFSGVIRYRNLHPDELGLLLWCLCLEDGCCQTLGMARSYGCGRMAVRIDELLEYDHAALSGSLTAEGGFREDTRRRVPELMACYRQEARRRLGSACPYPDLRDYPHIQEFLRLKVFERIGDAT